MTIEQRSANTWRIKQMIEGQWYRVTVDHKPSKREALELLAEAMKSGGSSEKGSFSEACQKYIDMRSNILSPRTIREYKKYSKRFPEWFQRLPVRTITQADVQRCVNEIAEGRAPKTVRTLHAFISCVLKAFRPNLVLRTALPKLQRKDPYIPRKEDLSIILNEAKNTQYYIPIKLACFGLRRGEICALDIEDLDEYNCIHITKDLVQAPSGEWVRKPPKTPKSVRVVPVSQKLADEIRAQGYIYRGHPCSITAFLWHTQNKYNLEHFSIHKLRHLFASALLDDGVDLKTIEDLGGWEGDKTLWDDYLHSMKLRKEEERKRIVDIISAFFD